MVSKEIIESQRHGKKIEVNFILESYFFSASFCWQLEGSVVILISKSSLMMCLGSRQTTESEVTRASQDRLVI